MQVLCTLNTEAVYLSDSILREKAKQADILKQIMFRDVCLFFRTSHILRRRFFVPRSARFFCLLFLCAYGAFFLAVSFLRQGTHTQSLRGLR